MEEISSLTEQELDVLLYICNVIKPIKPPAPEGEVTLNIIRAAKRESILNRVKECESMFKEEHKPIIDGLKTKLGIQ